MCVCVCVCLCLSVCLLPFDLHNCKVVLHFEHINRKLLLRMPGKTSQLFQSCFISKMYPCKVRKHAIIGSTLSCGTVLACHGVYRYKTSVPFFSSKIVVQMFIKVGFFNMVSIIGTMENQPLAVFAFLGVTVMY